MLGPVLLSASRSDRMRRIVGTAPITRPVVDRFVAGETLEEALQAVRRLADRGIDVTLDHLGEDVTDAVQARRTREAYLRLLDALGAMRLGDRAEVSVKLTAFGQALPIGGHEVALAGVRQVCEAADAIGTTVTLDMEDHTTVESTLRILAALREDHADVGGVIQSYLRRSEEYCGELAYTGSRIRLCKGAYDAPESVAFSSRADIDRSYVRCMKVLMEGQGYPMLATHDPRLIDIAASLAVLNDRGPRDFEYQMLYGVRPNEQRRLAGLGAQVRIYAPYGREWYGYLMRRLAERPANLGFFLRSLATRS